MFADGVAVQQVGEHTFPIVQATVDEIIRVTNDEICAAIKDIFDDTRTIVEPAGALAVAGLKAYVEQRGTRARQRLAAVLSGANMNFDRLRFVAERAELGEGREALLGGHDPRAARRVPRVLRRARRARRHRVQLPAERTRRRRRSSSASPPRRAAKARSWRPGCDGSATKPPICRATRWRSCTCATWSAAAAPDVDAERVCRFEFPERPGALLQFLDSLGGRWNISLFHYRNHGADFGRVLAAFEVPDAESAHSKRSCRAGLSVPARRGQRSLSSVPVAPA